MSRTPSDADDVELLERLIIALDGADTPEKRAGVNGFFAEIERRRPGMADRIRRSLAAPPPDHVLDAYDRLSGAASACADL